MPAPILKVWNTIRKIKVTGTAEKYNHIKLGKHFYRQKGNIQIHYQILKSPKQEQRMSSANLQLNFGKCSFHFSCSQAIIILTPKPGNDNTDPYSLNQLYS